MKLFFALPLLAALTLGACTMPYASSVPVDATTTFKLVGVDRINPLSMDTTGSAIYDCRTGEPCLLVNSAITNERSMLGAVAENAIPAGVLGGFNLLAAGAHRPDQINVTGGNATGGNGVGGNGVGNGGAGGNAHQVQLQAQQQAQAAIAAAQALATAAANNGGGNNQHRGHGNGHGDGYKPANHHGGGKD